MGSAAALAANGSMLTWRFSCGVIREVQVKWEQACSTCVSFRFFAEWYDLERDREVVGKLAYY